MVRLRALRRQWQWQRHSRLGGSCRHRCRSKYHSAHLVAHRFRSACKTARRAQGRTAEAGAGAMSCRPVLGRAVEAVRSRNHRQRRGSGTQHPRLVRVERPWLRKTGRVKGTREVEGRGGRESYESRLAFLSGGEELWTPRLNEGQPRTDAGQERVAGRVESGERSEHECLTSKGLVPESVVRGRWVGRGFPRACCGSPPLMIRSARRARAPELNPSARTVARPRTALATAHMAALIDQTSVRDAVYTNARHELLRAPLWLRCESMLPAKREAKRSRRARRGLDRGPGLRNRDQRPCGGGPDAYGPCDVSWASSQALETLAADCQAP